MKKSVPLTLLAAVILCLFLTTAAQAQNTFAYATVDYDDATNTIYGYAYTEPDYAASIYYQTAYVGGKLRDGSNTQLAIGSQQNYGKAELNLTASGNGNPPYRIQTGHYVFLSYYVSNYWDSYAYAYRSGYLDYNYYNYFAPGGAGSPVFDIPFFFPFLGRPPQAVTPSVNILLGTLLSEILAALQTQVTFKVATIASDSDSFSLISGLQAANLVASSSICNPSGNNTLTVTYDLAPSTTEVVSVVAKGFGSTSVSNWYVSAATHQDVFSSPPHGTATITFNNKNGGRTGNPPYNTIQVTVKAKFGSGATYTTTGRVRIDCP
jgi:hypothetical protein